MKALVVIHCELGYMDKEEISEESYKELKGVFDRIAGEAERYRSQGHRAYFLGSESMSMRSRSVYPAFRKYSPWMTHISVAVNGHKKIVDEQALELKEMMLEEGIGTADIAGVSYDLCVRAVYNILAGSEVFGFISREGTRKVAKGMGWGDKKFERIFDRRMDARIRRKLTDYFMKP